MHPASSPGRIFIETEIVTAKLKVTLLFSAIFIAMLLCTGWASTQQAVLQWGGLTTGPDRAWTIATFMDAYCGFLTFFAWVVYKEQRWLPRIGWFIGIMLLGNMAMSAYVLLQVLRLKDGQDMAVLLAARNP